MSARHARAVKPASIEWEVYRVGGPRGKILGTVRAADAEAALTAAFDEFAITPAERRRIMVRQVDA